MHRACLSRTGSTVGFLLFTALLLVSPGSVADVTNPAEVDNLLVARSGDDVQISWDPVTTDAAGNPETIDLYEIFRGEAPDFVPDKLGSTNRIDTSTTESFIDVGAAGTGQPAFHYLVSAVDADGNPGVTRPSRITTPPVLSGFWTDTTIELDWIDAQPSGEVVAYKVYRGQGVGPYEFAEDVGLSFTYSAVGLQTNVNWHFAVTAIDTWGNETVFSNEHTDPVGGTLDVQVHREAALCWGAAGCPPSDPDHVQRSDGFQLLVPAEFPVGDDWVRVDLTYTMESRLCTPPAGGNVTKCGAGNPCPVAPCNGGYNTCGDPWDRLAHLFLVLDDCIEQGHGCINNDNIELMRAATPFGTDARPPDGTGVVPPRVLTLDITPFAPLLTGTRYVGAHIGHFVQAGWWVSSEFHFSKRPEDTSPKKPADGFDPVFFHSSSSGLTGPFPASVPITAQQATGRLFITGHGGAAGDPTCGGNPADEFCQRTNRILVDSQIAWEETPWRDCCWPRGTEPDCVGCQEWNACGYPSCIFDRAGWCPGEIACHGNLDDGCDQDLPMTAHLLPGQMHDFEYEIVNINGSWSRSLVLYWYDDITSACGNNIAELGEACDGFDLEGESCQSQGFDIGTLSCQVDCLSFDTSACRSYECGNFICELSAGEDCLGCPSDCNGVQSGNPGNRYCCGDGEGDNPVDCSDARCTANGNTCLP